MYSVSDLYDSIVADTSHYFETKVEINGVPYGESDLMSVHAAYTVFSQEQPTVGGCLAAELEVKMLAPSATIPRMARVRPYIRAKNATQTSEWIPQGVFFIDTRETTNNDDGLNILTLHCYDAMLKAEADFPSTTISFPTQVYRVVDLISYTMGLQASADGFMGGVDARTKRLLANVYTMGLPVGYSMREVLGNIASMYGGNWIMNYDGQLRLVPLYELPSETDYLVDDQFEAITFGEFEVGDGEETRILV